MTAYEPKQTSGSSWRTPAHQPLYRAQQERPDQPFVCTQERYYQQFREQENQIPDFAAQHSVLREIRKHYILPVDSSVRNFLAEHQTVVQVLLDAVHQLKDHFGVATRFTLQAPVDESGRQTVYVVVLWPGKIDDVRVALAGFDDEWWIAHSRQASGFLTFTYELV